MVQRSERCLDRELGEIVVPVKTPATLSGTERPCAPLLHLGIAISQNMCRIGGRHGSCVARRSGAIPEIPPLF
jgi:hypothetical protein